MLAPTTRDAATTQDAARARRRITAEVCADFERLIESLKEGAGAVLLPEESLSSAQRTRFTNALAAQPPGRTCRCSSSRDPARIPPRPVTPSARLAMSRARASGSGDDAALVHPDGSPRPRAPVPDSRASRGARAVRRSRSASRTSARMSSSRHWDTSCAIRWRRCCRPCSC
jgi:hypothetical protein